MSADPDYAPPFWYRGRHLQTLWGPLLRHWRRPSLRRERLHTPDGDFLDLDWLAGAPERGPLLLILHGLEGSARSHYARGLLRGAGALGWRAAVMHFRSCSGEVNRLPKLYHSGETSDLEWVIGELAKREPAPRIGLVGVSLGGNVALKWLGEQGDAAPAEIRAAVAISTPVRPGRLRPRARPGLQPRDLHRELPAHHEGQDPRQAAPLRRAPGRGRRAPGAHLHGVRPVLHRAGQRLRRRGRLLDAGEQRALSRAHPAPHAPDQRDQRSVHAGRAACRPRWWSGRDGSRRPSSPRAGTWGFSTARSAAPRGRSAARSPSWRAIC